MLLLENGLKKTILISICSLKTLTKTLITNIVEDLISLSEVLYILQKNFFPELPKELHGYWETNTYISDDDWGHSDSEITELTRVEQKEKIIKEFYWAPVEEIEDSPSIPPLPKMD